MKVGVKINDLASKGQKKIQIEKLFGNVLAIDAFNIMFKFLSAIRYRDGKPLTDNEGNIVSHLSGIFYRTLNYLVCGIRPVYIFDGNYPELKFDTLEERERIREEAKRKVKEARMKGNLEEALKYEKMTSTLNSEMIKESKELINDFGVPYIQASGEGEAQAAYLVQNDDAWGVVSEDYDTLLFGGTRLLSNFSITKNTKNDTEIEYISLPKMLIDLKLRREQLVDMAILIGTDYNQGIKWVGQHTALKLIKKHGSLEKVINAGEEVRGKEIYVNTEIIKGIRDIYLNPSLKTDYGPLEWNKIRFEKLKERMINKHDFSQKRIGNGIKRLKEKIKE